MVEVRKVFSQMLSNTACLKHVSIRWVEDFTNFYHDMGAPPKGAILDRIKKQPRILS